MGDLVQLLVSGIATGAIYALAALGFTLLWQASGTINFAQGEFVMVPAFVMLFFMVAVGAPEEGSEVEAMDEAEWDRGINRNLRIPFAVTRAALSGLRAVAAWPNAPRPVSADALLPERALAGDAEAREALVVNVYEPLVRAGEVVLDTVSTFLDSGGALETTARALFVHANTVRYRLRRVAEICGEAPTDPRGALTLRVALALGRLDLLG